ncbi:MAG: type II toxin-antitoxin system Phd/YefM family antitoxin [Micrococcales bacterium]|nr:type II toxin-antitoxin system Phd/YefM family antitoxin [Micrococcales bacterium]
MQTVTMRELKQNPNAVVEKVLTQRVVFEVTSRGRPTGVVLRVANDPDLQNRADPDLTARINQACALEADGDERAAFAQFAAAQLAARTDEEW